MAEEKAKTIHVSVKPEEKFHKRIKMYCYKKGISMNDYFLELAEKDFERRKRVAKKKREQRAAKKTEQNAE